MIRYILRAIASLAFVLGFSLVVIPNGIAHTPEGHATCDGAEVSATNYEAGDTNTISLTVGDHTESRTFTNADSITLPVPQGGATTHVTGFVHTTNSNPAYTHDYSWDVGPCGTPPPPTKPEPVVTHASNNVKDCVTDIITTHHSTTTTDWVLVDNKWVKGEPVTTQDADTTRPATAEECPPPPPVDNCTDLPGNQPADFNCTPPAATVIVHKSKVKCGDTHRTVTTIRTPKVFDANTQTFVDGTATRSVFVKDIKAKDCPVKKPVTPVVHHNTTPPSPPGVLPNTGGTPLWQWALGIGLTLTGGAMRIKSRRMA